MRVTWAKEKGIPKKSGHGIDIWQEFGNAQFERFVDGIDPNLGKILTHFGVESRSYEGDPDAVTHQFVGDVLVLDEAKLKADKKRFDLAITDIRNNLPELIANYADAWLPELSNMLYTARQKTQYPMSRATPAIYADFLQIADALPHFPFDGNKAVWPWYPILDTHARVESADKKERAGKLNNLSVKWDAQSRFGALIVMAQWMGGNFKPGQKTVQQEILELLANVPMDDRGAWMLLAAAQTLPANCAGTIIKYASEAYPEIQKNLFSIEVKPNITHPVDSVNTMWRESKVPYLKDIAENRPPRIPNVIHTALAAFRAILDRHK